MNLPLGAHNSSGSAKPMQVTRAAVNNIIHIVFFTWLFVMAAVVWLLR